MQLDGRFRIVEHFFLRVDDLLQYSFRIGNIIAVGNSERHIHPALRLFRHVLDYTAPDQVVRQYDRLIVERQHRRIDETHLVNLAEYATYFDEVADIKRPVDQYHHPGRKIRQRILKRESNHETRNTETREQRAERNTQLRQGDQNSQHHDQVAGHRRSHPFQQLRQLKL